MLASLILVLLAAGAASGSPAGPGGEAKAAAPDGDVQPRIVGGTPVADGKHPFIAAVRDVTRGSDAYNQQFCAGTLVDPDSVLTAAHCMRRKTADQLLVTVGITALNENQGQTRQVAAIFRHPRFVAGTFENDAAILKLQSPVTGVEPVKIPARSSNAFEKPGRMATIAGWGSTVRRPPGGDETPNYPYRMREAKVPVVSDSRADNLYRHYVPRVMLAAGGEGSDTCQADSGAPIFVPTSTGRYQIGITSYGAGCGYRDIPGVYAEANSDAIKTFVENNIRR